MSLISDALKKAQDKRTPEQDKTEISASYLAPEKDAALSSKRSSSRILLYLLLAVALSLAGYYLYITTLAPKEPKTAAPAAEKTIIAPIGENTISKLIPKITPSNPQVSIPSGETALALTGIMYIGDSPQAIINGEVLNMGDTVEGYTITSIFPNKVVLSKKGKTSELYLR